MPAVFTQNLQKSFGFSGLNLLRLVAPFRRRFWAFGWLGLQIIRKMPGFDQITPTNDKGMFEDIFQFTHIARIGII